MRLVREGRIKIDPWDESMVQPASVDLRLGDSFRVFHNYRVTSIDLREPPSNLTEEVRVQSGEPFVIHPGEFALGRTLEYVEVPHDIVCRIEAHDVEVGVRRLGVGSGASGRERRDPRCGGRAVPELDDEFPCNIGRARGIDALGRTVQGLDGRSNSGLRTIRRAR